MNIKKFLNRKNILIILPFLLGVLVFACVKLAIHNPAAVEHYYSRGLYPFIAIFISVLSNIIPFSLWDISWIMLLILTIAGCILVIMKRITLKWYLLKFAQTAMLFYSLFYLLWGFNYFRPNIQSRLGWEATKPNEKVFRSILSLLIENANNTRVKIDQSQYAKINELVEQSYLKNSALLGISYHAGQRRPKTMLLSSYFAKSEVCGYFGPVFNEVHVNYYMMPLDYPFTLAHEKAHQFGFASEAEANMAAFMVCSASPDVMLQYSASLHMLLYFLNDAVHLPDYKDYLSKIDDGVMNDIMQKQEYYDKLTDKRLSRLQEVANDVYLKSNKIEHGVKNYNQVVGLVMSWYNHLISGKIESTPAFAQLGKK
jgi:signal transduction histidine kinase